MHKAYILIGLFFLGVAVAGGGAAEYAGAGSTTAKSGMFFAVMDVEKDIARGGGSASAEESGNLMPFPMWAFLKATNHSLQGVEPVFCPLWMMQNFTELVAHQSKKKTARRASGAD